MYLFNVLGVLPTASFGTPVLTMFVIVQRNSGSNNKATEHFEYS